MLRFRHVGRVSRRPRDQRSGLLVATAELPHLPLGGLFRREPPQARPALAAASPQGQTSGSNMISRTSCAQRQAAAILAAHSSASSREGTSISENPPMTALVSR